MVGFIALEPKLEKKGGTNRSLPPRVGPSADSGVFALAGESPASADGGRSGRVPALPYPPAGRRTF